MEKATIRRQGKRLGANHCNIQKERGIGEKNRMDREMLLKTGEKEKKEKKKPPQFAS